jgi:hypothetical protein
VAIENPGAVLQDRFEVIMEESSKMQVGNAVEALADGLNTSWDSGVQEPNPNLSESLILIPLMLNTSHECRVRRT